MLAARTNIYLPLYSPGTNLKAQINPGWCEGALRLVDKQNVDELARKISVIYKYFFLFFLTKKIV